MSQKYLVSIDISKKQEYIYSSNNLKDIIGASYIIKYVSEFLGREVIAKLHGKSADNYFEYGNSNGKIVYDKGGNSTFILDSEDEVKQFRSDYSKLVYKMFPELNFNVVDIEIDLAKDSFVEKLQGIEKKLFVLKNSMKSTHDMSTGYESFGFTKKCKHTGMPSGYRVKELNKGLKSFGSDEDELSSGTFVKRAMFYILDPYSKVNWKNNVLNKDGRDMITSILNESEYYKDNDISNIKVGSEVFDVVESLFRFSSVIKESKGFNTNFEEDDKPYVITNDIDDYMNDESSKIHAVTTADGNGMGKMFACIDKEYQYNYNSSKIIDEKNGNQTKTENEVYRTNLEFIQFKQKVSTKVEDKFRASLEKASEKLIKYKIKNGEIEGKNHIKLPLRVLISAGDDLTFLVGGNYLIDYLNTLTDELMSSIFEVGGIYQKFLNDFRLTLGIGSVLINSKYPLYKAIKKATELESASKRVLINKQFAEIYDAVTVPSNVAVKADMENRADKDRYMTVFAYTLYRGDINEDSVKSNFYIKTYQDQLKSESDNIAIEVIDKLEEYNIDDSDKGRLFHFDALKNSLVKITSKGDLRNSLTTELIGIYKSDINRVKEFIFTHNLDVSDFTYSKEYVMGCDLDTLSKGNNYRLCLYKDVFELSRHYVGLEV